MSLAELCIRRPVLSIVMSVVLVLFGTVGFFLLGVREYPAVDPPIVSVSTTYAGANAEVVDAQITEPIEQSLAGIAGIRTISSTSREGSSSIRVEFDLSVDLDDAANDVRDKVAQAVRRLPVDADPPVVEKADADSDPVVFITLRSETKGILEVSNVADTLVKERVQTIPGVSSVRIFGEKRYSMRLWLDAERMASHAVTPEDVRRALASQNVDLPGGRVEGDDTELSVRTAGRLATPEEFARVTIRSEGARTVRLEDVGWAELGPLNVRAGVRDQGRQVIGVAVIPQPNTNAIAIADELARRLDTIRKELPADYTLEVGYDFTKYVRRSVAEVEETLVVAFVLVALIIYAFLRSWRATLIPIVAIPVSIVSTGILVWALGFSINVLTLVGVVLAIGLVVDDAIVVLENVYAKIERGADPREAASSGSREIQFAILSTTVTLAVVFLPIIFLPGLTGKLFREFAVVVVGSVLVSGFVALTLSPMMCARLLTHGEPGWVYRVTEPLFVGLTRAYAWTLRGVMRARWLAIFVLAGLGWLSVDLFRKLPSELAPLEDRSNVRLNVRAPEGATYAYMEHQLDRIATWVGDNVPETSRTFSIVGGFGGQGTSVGLQNVYLVDAAERARTQEAIFQAIAKGAGTFDGVRAFPAQPPTIGSRFGGQPVQFVLQASTLAELLEVLPRFVDKASQRPELRFVDVDLKTNRPELAIELDRAKIDELGTSPLEVARAVQLALGGARYGYFQRSGKQYEVIGQLRERDRDEPEDLGRLFVRSARGAMVPLDAVVRRREGAGPAALYRYDRRVAATVSAAPAPGKTLGDGIAAMRAVAKETLPPTISTALAGQSRDFEDSSSSTALAFVFALVLVYLVLAAQFESFVDPLVILVTVPLSVSGALLSLHLTGQSLNVFSQIGIVLLIGLVTKNGILIVEFANQKRSEGASVVEAATVAAVERFRPILMTSLATILGILPIALSLGGAAGSRRSLGIAVAGGLTFALLLTLYVVPAVLALVARRRAPARDEALPAPSAT